MSTPSDEKHILDQIRADAANYGRGKRYPDYIRQKAIQLRVEKQMTLPDIAQCLGIRKSTLHYWLKNYPLRERTHKQKLAQRRAAEVTREKHRLLREEAYNEGRKLAPQLCKSFSFISFICMYIGEGDKKRRSRVAICNSDAKVMRLSHRWIQKFRNPENSIRYEVQIHVDQDEDEIKHYWAKQLGISPEEIITSRKSNSGQMSGRNFRSRYGVLNIDAADTYFKMKMNAWMDYVRERWEEWDIEGINV